jgi:hypothetical protein
LDLPEDERNMLLKYKMYYKESTNKMKDLWKAQSFSSKASEAIVKHLGGKFVIHNKTRWNSSYDAIRRVVQLAKRNKDAFDALCIELKVNIFEDLEIKFLREYLMVSWLKFTFNWHIGL